MKRIALAYLSVVGLAFGAAANAQSGKEAIAARQATQGQHVAQSPGSAFTVIGVFSDGTSASRILEVESRSASGDLENTGLLRIECTNGAVVSAAYKPRDAGSGMATGKRTHQPVSFAKDWNPATPKLSTKTISYDVKKVEGTGARAADDGWTLIELADGSSLCPDHAISTKGTGVAGRASGDLDCDADTEEVDVAREPRLTASQNSQVLRHAINSKGTGASRVEGQQSACMAIKSKGTGAQ